MYTEVIKRTDEQAVTKPEAAGCGVTYVDPRTTVNEQRCVGKYFMCATPEQPRSVQIYFRKPTKDDSPGSKLLYPVWTAEANFFHVVPVGRGSYPNATPETDQDCQLQWWATSRSCTSEMEAVSDQAILLGDSG